MLLTSQLEQCDASLRSNTTRVRVCRGQSKQGCFTCKYEVRHSNDCSDFIDQSLGSGASSATKQGQYATAAHALKRSAKGTQESLRWTDLVRNLITQVL